MKKLLLLILLVASPSWATTRYLNKAGSDANSCATSESATDANAKLTLSGAAGAISCMVAGDTLMIGDGTYTEGAANTIPAGAAGTPTVIQAENYNVAILRPTLSGDNGVIQITARSYITLTGLYLDAINLTGTTTNALWVTGASTHIIFQNGTLTHGGRGDANDSGNGFLFQDGATASNSILTSTISDNGSIGTTLEHGGYNRGASNTISGNTFTGNAGYCVQNYTSGSEDPSDVVISGNICTTGGTRGGFYIGWNRPLVMNNLIYGNPRGIDLASTNGKIYNNTIYNNSGNAIWLVGGTGTAIKNNILFSNSTDNIVIDSGSMTESNNLKGIDPNFTNPGSADFTLTPASVNAIDAGATLAEVVVDYVGRARPVGASYDIGAYEYDNPATASITVTAPLSGSVQLRPATTSIAWTTANISSGTVNITYSFDNFLTSYAVASAVAYNASPYSYVTPDWPKQSTMQVRVCQGVICGTSPSPGFTTEGLYIK